MVIIKVTQKHLDAGVRGSCGSCPVALAVGEVVDCGTIMVDEQTIYLYQTTNPDKSGWIDHNCAQQIRAFDNGLPVEPFEFEAEIPESWLKEKSTNTI